MFLARLEVAFVPGSISHNLFSLSVLSVVNKFSQKVRSVGLGHFCLAMKHVVVPLTFRHNTVNINMFTLSHSYIIFPFSHVVCPIFKQDQTVTFPLTFFINFSCIHITWFQLHSRINTHRQSKVLLWSFHLFYLLMNVFCRRLTFAFVVEILFCLG